jgi:hypothetical protein
MKPFVFVRDHQNHGSTSMPNIRPKTAAAKMNTGDESKDKKKKKEKKRGTLFEFFDADVTEKVYKQDPESYKSPPKYLYSEKKKSMVSQLNGTLKIDEKKLLKETQKEFTDHWFYNTIESTVPQRRFDS